MTDPASSRPDTSDMPAVHQVFRSSLASAPAFIGSTTGDDERRELVADYYRNVIAFLEVHHDSEETLVFPLLRERAPDRLNLVERAAVQHESVVGSADAVKAGLRQWVAAGDPQAETMIGTLQALEGPLVVHLDEEEADILPLAAEFLSVEEWGALPGHGFGHFQGDKVWLILGLIRENRTPEQCDAMMAAMPPPARDMWVNIGEASFNDMIARVRQSA